MLDRKINKNHELCLSIFDQLFDWEIYLNFICFALYDRSPRPFRWHWLTVLGNCSESHRFWLHREREIDAISVDWRNPPNLWLRFSQQERKRERKKNCEMFITSTISYLLSTTGLQLKTIYEMVFAWHFDFWSENIKLTKIIAEQWNWSKWMNERCYRFHNEWFWFCFFPNYIDRLKKEQYE